MTWKKWLLGLASFIVVLAGGTQIDNLELGGRTNEQERIVFDAIAITTTSVPFLVNDFAHIAVTVAASSTTGTVQFACTTMDSPVTLVDGLGKFVSTTKNIGARWDWVEIVDLEDGTTIDGDTGITLSGLVDVRQFEINTNNFRYCMAYHGRSSGTTTVTFRPMSNL